MRKTGLLDVIAEQHRTYISNLRLLPELKWASLGDLYRLPDKEKYPLKEWEEAVSYPDTLHCRRKGRSQPHCDREQNQGTGNRI